MLIYRILLGKINIPHKIITIPYRICDSRGLNSTKTTPPIKLPRGIIMETKLSVNVETLPKRDASISF